MVSAQNTRVSAAEEAQLWPDPVETGSPDSQQPEDDDPYGYTYEDDEEVTWDQGDLDHSEDDGPYPYTYEEVTWDHENLNDYYHPYRERKDQVGLHPIILGDTLGQDRRYKVHRKLGAGGSATVWLCRDQKDEKWVAIKVLSHSASQAATDSRYLGEMAIFDYFRDDLKVDNDELVANHVCVPDSYFVQDGPNGQHFCFVLPVLSGDIRDAFYHFYDKPEVLREICAQMVVAMHYLHGKGICHGDFRPANILFYVDGIEDATENEINAMFPESERFEMKSTTDEELFPNFPKFIYSSSNQIRVLHPGNIHIMVSDFGEAYYGGDKPEFLGIPVTYAAPEVMFENFENHQNRLNQKAKKLDSAFGMATDVWSLGMSILELRHSKHILPGSFNPFPAVRSLEGTFGPLPEPYRSIWFSDEFQIHIGGRPWKGPSNIPLTKPVTEVEIWKDDYNSTLEKIIREPSESLYRMEKGEDLSLRPGQSPVGDGYFKRVKSTIPEEEAQQLLGLLSGIFSEDISMDVPVGVPEESMVSEMVDIQPGLTSSRTEPKEEDEVFYDALGIPVPAPPARGGVARMLA